MYGLYGLASSKRCSGPGLQPAGLFDETPMKRRARAPMAPASTFRAPSTLIAYSSGMRRGWMMPQRWNTVAPSAPRKKSPSEAGSHTSPGTSSMRGEISDSTVAGTPGSTRQRMRRSGSGAPSPGTSGSPFASTRTSRVPSQPGAPVTRVRFVAARVVAFRNRFCQSQSRRLPQMPARARLASFALGAALVLAGLAAGLVVAEIALRLFPQGRLTIDLRALHELRPDRAWLYGM